MGGDRPTTPTGDTETADTESARSRATGGVPHAGAPDTHSTTGTTPNETFVGRASGDDPGDVGTSGAEMRAQHDEQAPSDADGRGRRGD